MAFGSPKMPIPIFIIVFTVFSEFTVTAQQKKMIQPNVAIIGAGFAGLRAARRFQESGTNYTVFEGSNRVGGRVYPIPYKDGYLQFGAEYVNGVNNEIYDIVKKHQLASKNELEDNAVETYVDGNEVRGSILDQWYSFEESTSSKIEKDAGKKMLSLNYSTISESIDYYYNQFLIDLKSKSITLEDSKVLEYLKKGYKNSYQIEWSAKSDDLCLKNLDIWDSGNMDIEFTLNRNGFRVILDEMKASIPSEKIRMNSKVVNIDNSGSSPKITLSNGQSFYYDAVIVTSSLGYLKAHHQTFFTPALPADKKSAVENSGFGQNMKVLLEFERRWWPRGATIQLSGAVRRDLDRELMVFQASLWAENVLVVWLAGDGPLLASKISDSQLTTIIYEFLLNNLKDHYDVTKIQNIYRHNWIEDEFALGSYSYISKATCQTKWNDSTSDIRKLGEPISKGKRPVICFAGEHTDVSMYQTVVGASRSGLKEANRILNYYR